MKKGKQRRKERKGGHRRSPEHHLARERFLLSFMIIIALFFLITHSDQNLTSGALVTSDLSALDTNVFLETLLMGVSNGLTGAAVSIQGDFAILAVEGDEDTDNWNLNPIDEISSDCSGVDETRVACSGSSSGYICTDLEDCYMVSGLAHSGAVETPDVSASSSTSTSGGSGSSGSDGGGRALPVKKEEVVKKVPVKEVIKEKLPPKEKAKEDKMNEKAPVERGDLERTEDARQRAALVGFAISDYLKRTTMDLSIYWLAFVVFLMLLVILLIVFHHTRKKPHLIHKSMEEIPEIPRAPIRQWRGKEELPLHTELETVNRELTELRKKEPLPERKPSFFRLRSLNLRDIFLNDELRRIRAKLHGYGAGKATREEITSEELIEPARRPETTVPKEEVSRPATDSRRCSDQVELDQKMKEIQRRVQQMEEEQVPIKVIEKLDEEKIWEKSGSKSCPWERQVEVRKCTDSPKTIQSQLLGAQKREIEQKLRRLDPERPEGDCIQNKNLTLWQRIKRMFQ